MKQRIQALDGLRAVACLAVMAFHTSQAGLVRGGFLGVDVFFVLSGFLVALQLSRADASPRLWLYRRAARLWPALLALSAVALPAAVLGSGSPTAVLAGLLYVYNPLVAAHWPFGDDSITAHTWSLSIEMQFYAAAAVAVVLLARARRAPRPGVLVGLAVASYAVRVAYVMAGDSWRGYFATESRLDGLLLGAALGVLASSGRLPRLPHAAWTAAPLAVLLVTAEPHAPSGMLLGTPVAAFFAASVICHQRPALGLTWHLLAGLGLRTYSLYLWHQPVFEVLRFHCPLQGWLLIVGQWTVAFAVAEVSYRWVETPARRSAYRWIADREVRADRMVSP